MKDNNGREASIFQLSIDLQECSLNEVSSKNQIRKFAYGLCDILCISTRGIQNIVEHNADMNDCGHNLFIGTPNYTISARFVEDARQVFLDIQSRVEIDREYITDYSKKFFKASGLQTYMTWRGYV